MPAAPTPHEILGVQSSASHAEIEAAYLARLSEHANSANWIRVTIERAYRDLSTVAHQTQRNDTVRRPNASWLTESLPLQNETTYFILVNVLDIFMTYLMLNLGAVESNPIANYFYYRYGFPGMIAFKLILVALVCTVAQVVARRNMRYAKFILWAGITVVGIVVLYSTKLLVGQIH